ncbi:hypothetical protein [uncultured Oscillibacter sp.]|uniref:hypothetical protein n=1 Tax=uncultured Oscillibacter sp. TaxID=876091 RepID=UPI00260FF51C|nr:hypothetical protein [uncultured Oscillibacter sp.]
MRRWMCVPMMTLLFLALPACGGGAAGEETEAVDFRDLYHDCAGCAMEAVVTCDQEGLEWEARLLCDYVPGGESTVEVLEPETVAGVKAVLEESGWRLEYEGDVLNAGALGEEAVSPALCLPRLMNALRDGWLLEENEEAWNEVPCLRLTVDQSGAQDGKILSTLWLKLEDGTPLRGEIAVDGEIILTADFTSFRFYDTIPENTG